MNFDLQQVRYSLGIQKNQSYPEVFKVGLIITLHIIFMSSTFYIVQHEFKAGKLKNGGIQHTQRWLQVVDGMMQWLLTKKNDFITIPQIQLQKLVLFIVFGKLKWNYSRRISKIY